MKFIRKCLILFAWIGFSLFTLEAKTLTIMLDNTTNEIYTLDALVHQSKEASHPQYCQQLIIENQSSGIIKDCLPASNGQIYYTLDNLAELLAKDKRPLLTLYQIWQKSLHKNQLNQSTLSDLNALDYLNFIGSCSSSEYEKKFIQLCHLLGIDARQACVKGKIVYDFCCKGDEWSYLDLSNGQIYLNWDNATLASSETIMDDPLLVLRTKSDRKDAQMDFAKAWHQLAHLEIVDPHFADDQLMIQPEINAAPKGFDLYPNERLIYRTSAIDLELSPYEISVTHVMDWSARKSLSEDSYHSPFPIKAIHNGTDSILTLKNQQISIEPGHSYTFEEQKVFLLDILTEGAGIGEVRITSSCAWTLFPSLRSGLNLIELGTKENPCKVKFIYEVDEKLENLAQPAVGILNEGSHFENCSPYFLIETPVHCPAEMICWQISSDIEFKTVPSNFEQVQPFAAQVTLPLITETLFNPDETYYFRVKGSHHEGWSDWSKPFAFTVEKPQSVGIVEFDKCGEHAYEINWSRGANLSDTETEYLIFGSNSFDFIPSIYCAAQVNKIVDGEVIVEEANDNLIAMTTDTKIVVDGSMAYYRIVARQNGQLSVPSSIIHVYDVDLVQARNVLQIVKMEPGKLVAKRVLIPVSYSWAEPALPRLGVKNRLLQNSLLELHTFIADMSSGSAASDSSKIQAYVKPAHVSKELWEKLRRYFLPENHPYKQRIDRIFAKSRVILSYDTIRKAGFKGKLTPVRRVFAGVHPECSECFFKMYTDNELNLHYHEWEKWLHRIGGKETVKKCIKKYGYDKWFYTPHKWIYPLPEKPACPRSTKYLPKNFILVCSNERPYEHYDNEKMWKNKFTREMLDALYILIDEAGMWDSVFAFNVPFSKKDGRLCFVDTEYSNKWPIRFDKLNRYFSSENVKYWQYLIKHNGPAGYKSPHPH